MNRHIILLVDDEKEALEVMKELLEREGYKVLTALNGKEGLEKIKKNQVSLVISDQQMPGMKGTEFLRQVRLKSPQSIRMMLTGYVEDEMIEEARRRGDVYQLLSKPWSLDINQAIRQALAQYDSFNPREAKRVVG